MTQTQVVDELFEQGEREEPGGRNKKGQFLHSESPGPFKALYTLLP